MRSFSSRLPISSFFRGYSTANKVISCRAAIAFGPKKPLSIETIEVAPPKANEVRIKLKYASTCITDEYTLRGAGKNWPVILGHECAGIVESVGDGVTELKPGDHVIPTYVPQCGECVYCKHERTGLCNANKSTIRGGTMADGTVRFSHKGKDVHHYMGFSGFTEYTVASKIQVCKINDSAPLNKVCVIGCGVTNGYGASTNASKVTQGSSVAVWGLGTVGLSAIMGAKASGATTIVGIDPNESRFAAARSFGATHCVNPKNLPPKEKLQNFLVKEFKGGFDYTFECVGNVQAMREAFESARHAWGECCVIGLPPRGDMIEIIPFYLLSGRTLRGSIFGNYKGLEAVPKLVEDYMAKKLKLDELISKEYELEDINEAFEEMKAGKCFRNVIKLARD